MSNHNPCPGLAKELDVLGCFPQPPSPTGIYPVQPYELMFLLKRSVTDNDVCSADGGCVSRRNCFR